MSDVIIFINKMKAVFNVISDEEIDEYNDIYNDKPTEELVTWINSKYKEYKSKINAN